MATAEDYGDYLLRTEKISGKEYDNKQEMAKKILNNNINKNDELRIEAVRKSAETKKYSVLMSLYKKENPEYLKSSIDSMLNQSVKPDEIVMVEDGPLTPELYAVLDSYPILHRVRNKTNLGLGLALNAGLKECRNELVARMDTDDCSKPERCEKQLARFLEKPYLSIVGSHIDEFVDDISNVISQRIVPTTSDDIYNFAKNVRHLIIQQLCIVKQRCLKIMDILILKEIKMLTYLGVCNLKDIRQKISTKLFFGLEVLMNWQREERVGKILGATLLLFVSFGKWDIARLQIM